MENKETFKFTYSAGQQEEIELIRKKYLPKEENKMEQLRALDASVNKKATMLSIIVGVVGTMLMGVGMSLTMSDFGKILGDFGFVAGIVIGIAGIGILACAYPLYHHTLKNEREKIAPEIIRLTDELMLSAGEVRGKTSVVVEKSDEEKSEK